jgi:predicted transcriptional regulator of viral defense system
MRQNERLEALGEIADDQRGHVTTAQAERVAVSRVEIGRLASRGLLERVSHGVYRLLGSGYDPNSSVRSAWLALEPRRTAAERLGDPAGIVVSHASAAALHQLGDLGGDILEFTADRRIQSMRDGVRIHRGAVPPGDVTIVDGLPTTTVLRTIVDLIGDGHDGEHVGAVIVDAVRRGAVSLHDLELRLATYAARRGHAKGDGAALLDDLLGFAGLDRASLRNDLLQSTWAQQLVSAGAMAGMQSALRELAKYMSVVNPDVDAINANVRASVELFAQSVRETVARSDSGLTSPDLLQVTELIRQLERVGHDR